MRAVTLAIALAIVAHASSAVAQPADDGAPAQADDAGGDARAPEAIELEVGAREARAIDVGALREALARELGIDVRVATAAAIEAPRVRVRRISRGEATLELVRPDRSRMRRRAVLPADPAERLETIVILAVNMVRDEASELLAMLRRRRATVDEPQASAGSAASDGASLDATQRAGAASTAEADTAEADTTEADTATTDTATTDTTTTGTAEADTATTDTAATDTATTDTAAADTATTDTADDAAATERPTPPADTPPDASRAAAASAEFPDAAPAAPGHRFFRIALGALLGSVPRGSSYEMALVSGLELAWTPEDFLAFGVRDLGGGSLLDANGRWSAGGAAFAELGWVVDPALVLHLELGADVRINGSAAPSAGVAPLLLVGARWFPIRDLSLALQSALHVVATESWSGNLHALPQGAVLWTIGLSIAGHVS